MGTIRSLIATVVVAAFLSVGCATNYQSKGFKGGFQDTQLAPDVYRVSFSGNGFTSADRVQDFALLRAAELTLANNGRYFAVISTVDQSRTQTHFTPGSAYTTGTVSSFGNSASYSGTTTYTAPQVHTYYNPGVGMMIRTFESKPNDVMTFDAAFLAASIRAKYRINER